MAEASGFIAGPLTPGDLAQLEATLLPALERHHLRLLAHCLRTLQQIAGGRHGPLPGPEALLGWVSGQPPLAEDHSFQQAFLAQLQAAARQLETLAAALGVEPLALDLPDLIRQAEAQARRRLDLTPPGAAAPPPG
jgi:hypothetical protein